MKRNPDLIRQLLMYIEENTDADSAIHSKDITIEGRTSEEIIYHILLLEDAGMIECIDASSLGGTKRFVRRLTNDGHEFLEAARNDKNWIKAKESFAKAGGFVMELAKPLLIEILKQSLGLKP